MGDLSRHFNRSEFACRCGCGFDTVDAELLTLCELARAFINDRVTIGSGCRCPSHNNKIGGSVGSQHKLGRAADLHVSDPRTLFNYLDRMYFDSYGIGLYAWGVHIDSRTNGPARWKG